jgi:hypothetical protein
MSVQPFIFWLLAAFVPAVIGQVMGARAGSAWMSGAAALFLPVMSTFVALRVNAPYWTARTGPAGTDEIVTASRRNARLLAWTWGAGAASMLAVYMLSGLRWQHGWQYGLGMALIAVLGFAYSLRLGDAESALRTPGKLKIAAMLAAAQGIAAIGGILVLVLSGKVASVRADWAANIIFVAGGLAITVLSAIAVRTYARLNRDELIRAPELNRDGRGDQPVS